MIARKRQWTNLQEAKLRRFAGLPGQSNRELDFHGNSQSIFAGLDQRLKDRWQGKQSVFEHAGEAHDADSGPAYAVIHRLVIDRIGGTDVRQCAVSFSCIEAETHFVQVPGLTLANAV